jgi:NAD(P)-dependent dehydrogenase (short-subunit alcohol dehydrogenase family)
MKNILITGAATGLGAALSEHFLQQGCCVWGSYHSRLPDAAWVAKHQGHFLPFHLDLCQEAAIQAAATQVDHALAQKGEHLSLVINNAACIHTGPLLELTTAEMTEEYHVNVLAPVLMARYFRPLLAPRPDQRVNILNISSYNARVPLPFIGSYAASKSALSVVNRALDAELMPYRLRAVNILLGMVQTGVLEKQLERLPRFHDSDYWPWLQKRAEQAHRLSKRGYSVNEAAAHIVRIAQKPHPANEYTVAKQPLFLHLAAYLAQTRWYRHIIRNIYFS